MKLIIEDKFEEVLEVLDDVNISPVGASSIITDKGLYVIAGCCVNYTTNTVNVVIKKHLPDYLLFAFHNNSSG